VCVCLMCGLCYLRATCYFLCDYRSECEDCFVLFTYVVCMILFTACLSVFVVLLLLVCWSVFSALSI